MGMASMEKDPYDHASRPPKSLSALKDEYVQWLEAKNKRGWKWALKDAFQRTQAIIRFGGLADVGGVLERRKDPRGERIHGGDDGG